MIFSGFRSTSATTFRNLHSPSKSQLGESSELWARAMVPLVEPAKPQIMRLTWGGAGALDEAAIASSSEPSKALHQSVPERVNRRVNVAS